MAKILDGFISYGRADSKAFAQNLQARLAEQEFEVWFDFNDIPLAVDYQNQIDDGIEKASHFLFIISPHSANSPYCGKEIELAIKLNKRIIPLMHVEEISREIWQERNPHKTSDDDWEAAKAQGLNLSKKNLHPIARKLNWVWFREDKDDFEKSLAGLIDLLRSHADYVERHTRLLVKALEWERNHKQTRYLLVGEEKQQAAAWLKVRFKDEQPPCVPTDLHCEFITESIKNGNNLMSQAFLSYADEDKETMEKIRNSLRRESITVWTNTTDLKTGEAFEEAINRGIEEADNVVYLLSPDSISSTYCQQELEWALSLHKRIIPVLVRETEPTQVPSALRSLHYIDLTDNVREEDYRLDESELLKILLTDAAYYNEHKILLTKALKWQRQQKNPSILLRGYNLRSAETWLKVAQKRKQHPPTPLQEEFIAESRRQPPLQSLDVFVSYSRADSDFARKLNDSLQMQGKTTWFDQESIASGTDFQQEINRGIKASDNFLFILSPRSVNSPYCKDEVEYAASLNKRFVTVLHRQVDTSDLHPELAKVQWLDFNRNDRDFNANFNQLVRTLDTDREHLRSHTKWLQRALEWQNKNKTADLLLRGNEFIIAEDWLSTAEQENKRPAATPLQKEFILESEEAIAAGIKREKRRVAILWSLLGLVSVVAVVAVGLYLRAEESRRRAERAEIEALVKSSEAYFELGEQFNALEAALEAAERLKAEASAARDSNLRASVVTSLQQSLYSIEESNRLEGHEGKIADASFSYDGKNIATVGYDKTVKVWRQDGSLISSKTFENSETLKTGAKYSPDGRIMATDTKDKKVKLWRRDGSFLSTLQDDRGLYFLEFGSDSQTIATRSNDSKTIKLWGQDGTFISMLEEEKEIFVFLVAFSPDGQTIATINNDETGKQVVRLWQRNGTLTDTLEVDGESLTGVTFSPDGEIIATVSDARTVKLWGRDGTAIATLTGHNELVNLVEFSPDGQKIVTASIDGTVKLWHRNGARYITLFKAHGSLISDVSFSPDGKIMATASADKTVKLWQEDGTPIVTLTGHNDWVTKVRFSPDGKTLVSLSEDTTVKLWQLEDNGLIKTIASDKQYFFINPDRTLGSILATVGKNGSVKLWRADADITPVATLIEKSEGNVRVRFVDGGQTLVTAVNKDKTFYGPIQLWQADGTLIATLVDKTAGQGFVSVGASRDGQTIVTAVSDPNSYGLVQLWQAGGTLVATLVNETSSQGSVGVDISSDGQTIIATVRDRNSYGPVQLWQADGTPVATLIEKNKGTLQWYFSPDGQTILTITADESDLYTLQLWQADGTPIETLIEKSPEPPQWAFSNDGRMLAILVSDGDLKLWQGNGTVTTLSENGQKYTNIWGFSPDNKTVALGTEKEIALWSTDSSAEPVVIPTGHKGDISRVVFSPDGQTIATASYDNTVKLWQQDGEFITNYTHPRGVTNLYFSADGNILASVDEKGTVTVRRIDGMTDLDQLLGMGCEWIDVYLENSPNVDDSDRKFCAKLE